MRKYCCECFSNPAAALVANHAPIYRLGLAGGLCVALLELFAFRTISTVAKDCYGTRDNVGGVEWAGQLCSDPIDLVYTWVNGSDPLWQADMLKWRAIEFGDAAPLGSLASELSAVGEGGDNGTDGEPPDPSAANRYRDNDELLYSMRSVFKYAPWVRNIILVTNGQVPSWLDLSHPRIRVVTHAEIFAHTDALPVFSSPAIEMNLHRITGLSRRFLYFNDDVLLGAPVQPDDFDSPSFGQRVFLDWAIPRCHAGCVETWIGDGYCDDACNVSACMWDAGDCSNGTVRSRHSPTVTAGASPPCVPGCPNSWIADKMCDARCNVRECAYDGGDCGVASVQAEFPGDTAVAGLVQGGSVLLADTEPDTASNAWDVLMAATEGGAAAGAAADKPSFALRVDINVPVLPDIQPPPAPASGEASLPSPSPQPGRSTHAACRQLTAVCSTEAECGAAGWAAAMNRAWQSIDTGAPVVSDGDDDSWSLNVTLPGVPGGTLVVPTGLTPVAALPVAVAADAGVYLNVSAILGAVRAYGTARIAGAIAAQHAWLGLREANGQGQQDPRSCAVLSSELMATCQAIAQSESGATHAQAAALRQWQHKCRSVSGSLHLLASDIAHIARQVDFTFSGGARSKSRFVRRAAVWAPLKQVVLALDTATLPSAAEHFSQTMRMSERAIFDAATHMAREQGLLPAGGVVGGDTSVAALQGRSRRALTPGAAPWGAAELAQAHKGGEGGVSSSSESATDVDVDDLMLRSDEERWELQRKQRAQREQSAARGVAGQASPLDLLRPVPVAQLTLLLHIKAEGSMPPLLLRHTDACKGSGVRGTVFCSAMGQTVHALHVLSVPLQVNIENTVLPESLPPKPKPWETADKAPRRTYVSADMKQGRRGLRTMVNLELVQSEFGRDDGNTQLLAVPGLSDWAQAARSARGQIFGRLTRGEPSQAADALSQMRLAWHSLVRQTNLSSPAGGSGHVYRLLHGEPRGDSSGAAVHVGPVRRGLLDQYGLSLVFSNRMINQEFGAATRRVPAHMPHLINKRVVESLIQRFPAEVLATEHHRFRHARDLQYAFAYFHFLVSGGSQPDIDLQHYWRQELDTDASGRLEWNELRTLAAVVYGKAPEPGPARDLLQCLLPGYPIPASVDITQLSAPVPAVSFDSVLQCSLAVQGLRQHARFPPTHLEGDKSEVGFEMIVDDINITRTKLDGLRARKPKFICINDDMRQAPISVQRTVRDFFESIVPKRCPAELPIGQQNPEPLYRDVALAYKVRMRWAVAKVVAVAGVLTATAWALHRRAKWRAALASKSLPPQVVKVE